MRGEVIKETLVRQPSYTLQLLKSWSDEGKAEHAFVLHPTVLVGEILEEQGVTLMMGEGHDVSRRDMHYALYLFQRFHMSHGQESAEVSAGTVLQ